MKSWFTALALLAGYGMLFGGLGLLAYALITDQAIGSTAHQCVSDYVGGCI